MKTAIEPFGPAHLDGAAELYAARQARERERWPCLPAHYESPEAARHVIAALLEEAGTEGVAAVTEDARVVGYMLAQPKLPDPASGAASMWRPRSVSIPYTGHAAHPDCAYDAYRLMYAALSERWVERGLFAHYTAVNARDDAAVEAFLSLGFARDSVRALRSTQPVKSRLIPRLSVRLAAPGDIEDVMRMEIDLFKYHAGPPVYMPHLPEAFSGQRPAAEGMILNTACAVFLAVLDRRAVGLLTLKPSEPHPGTPRHTIYLTEGYTAEEVRGTGAGSMLLAAGMEWARARRYEWCSLNYLPSNILAARFWTHGGFEPLGYRMVRTVDERIAWARG